MSTPFSCAFRKSRTASANVRAITSPKCFTLRGGSNSTKQRGSHAQTSDWRSRQTRQAAGVYVVFMFFTIERTPLGSARPGKNCKAKERTNHAQNNDFPRAHQFPFDGYFHLCEGRLARRRACTRRLRLQARQDHPAGW